MKKRLMSMVLACVMTASLAAPVLADEKTDLINSIAQRQEELSWRAATIEELSGKRAELQSQIQTMNADMVDLMVQIGQAEDDIDTTQKKIKTTSKEIKTTAKKLKKARKNRDAQYDAMKKRIQYIYENGGQTGWLLMVLGSDDMSALLNKADYATELESTDREALNELKATVKEVSDLKHDLEDRKTELEGQEKNLKAQKTALEEDRTELDRQIEETKAVDEDYEGQIEEAQDIANALTRLIREENERIWEIEEEERRAAEEAARRAAAEAARRAAAEEAARNRASRSVQRTAGASSEEDAEEVNDTSEAEYEEDVETLDGDDFVEVEESYSEESYDEEYEEDESYEEESYDEEESYEEESYEDDEEDYDYNDVDYVDEDAGDEEDYDLEDVGEYDESGDAEEAAEDYDDGASDEETVVSDDFSDLEYADEESGEESTSSSSSSGGDSGIVNYADQFVGNPYAWGGNSLTNGIDCSHFVYQVLKNTGYYSGGYTSSGGWASLGSSVSSLSEAKAGDVIVYSGHVAIYDGNGGIVEAKGSQYDITHDRAADSKSIVAIRRFT